MEAPLPLPSFLRSWSLFFWWAPLFISSWEQGQILFYIFLSWKIIFLLNVQECDSKYLSFSYWMNAFLSSLTYMIFHVICATSVYIQENKLLLQPIQLSKNTERFVNLIEKWIGFTFKSIILTVFKKLVVFIFQICSSTSSPNDQHPLRMCQPVSASSNDGRSLSALNKNSSF